MVYAHFSEPEQVMVLETYEKVRQWSAKLAGIKADWRLTDEGRALSSGGMFAPGRVIPYERQFYNRDSDNTHERYFFMKVVAVRKGTAPAKSDIRIGHGSAAYLRQTYPDIVVQLPDGRQISWLVYVAQRHYGNSAGDYTLIAQISPEAERYMQSDVPKGGRSLVYGWMGNLSASTIIDMMKQEKERQQAESIRKMQQKLAQEQAQQKAAAAREREKALAKDAADLFDQL